MDEQGKGECNSPLQTAEIRTPVVKCPRCGRIQEGVEIREGRLYVAETTTQLIGYVCEGCERAVHWGKTGDKNAQRD